MEYWHFGPLGNFIQKQFISFVFVAITYYCLNRYMKNLVFFIVAPIKKVGDRKGLSRHKATGSRLTKQLLGNAETTEKVNNLYLESAEYNFKKGNYEKAFALLEKAVDWFPSLHTLYKAGVLYQRFGHKEKARKIFKEIVEDYKAKLKFRKRAEWRWAVCALVRSLLI